LKTRVKDYSYRNHFGGVYYLFVRGMSPKHPGKAGIFYDVPDLQLISSMSTLLEGRQVID